MSKISHIYICSSLLRLNITDMDVICNAVHHQRHARYTNCACETQLATDLLYNPQQMVVFACVCQYY